MIYAIVILGIAIVYIVYLNVKIADLRRCNNWMEHQLLYPSPSRADQYGPLNHSHNEMHTSSSGLRLIKGGRK